MRIGVEGLPLVGERSGVGRYVLGLIEGLLTAACDDLRLTTVLPRGGTIDAQVRAILSLGASSHVIPSRIGWRAVRYGNLVGVPVPYQILSGEQDAFLFTVYRTFSARGRPRAAMIYDLGFRTVPETIEPSYVKRLERYVEQVVDSDTHVITISKAVEAELLREFPELRGRTSVLYPGRSTSLSSRDCDDRVLEDWGLRPGYVLFVGNLEPRKNLERLVRAHAQLPHSVSEQHPLVLVGPDGWLNDGLEILIERMGDRVRRIPYQSDERLLGLFEAAGLLAFPTLYEGFGLPVLEALELGVPVACSDLPVLREVAGGLPTYFDPTDVDSISQALASSLAHPPTAGELAEGRVRAGRFDWTATGRRGLEVFRDLVG